MDKHQMMVEMQKAIRRQPTFLSLAALFRPMKVVGFEKIRLGSGYDGGYVMIDDFAGIEAALSYGVETNADWDLEMVQRGIPIQQYDHSIEFAPVDHNMITWHKKMIVGTPAANGVTLGDTLKHAGLKKPNTGILKIDIEGYEWEVFDNAKDDELARFTQVVVEMHDMGRCKEDAYLLRCKRVMQKLSKHFGVYHVHANNWSPLVEVSGVWFPETLEVSFASRTRYEFVETDEIFPTLLDQPCNPMLPDVFLGNFKFA